ncbi:hypothetical protein [Helicobacter sp. 16-1353]|nr:hypothetical protein [Helicobacter sp. 16-1353]
MSIISTILHSNEFYGNRQYQLQMNILIILQKTIGFFRPNGFS